MKVRNQNRGIVMPFKFCMALFAIVVFCLGSVAHAQADKGGNGGVWSEGDLKHFLNRLVPYLSSPEGKNIFPEIVVYDQAHDEETVEKVASILKPRLVNGPVYDKDRNERDCVSYTTPIRYFECNVKALPPKPKADEKKKIKSEYYGSLYRLVLHEVFVQVGLEKPLMKEVPSDYTMSSRLMVHLENFPEWLPGGDDNWAFAPELDPSVLCGVLKDFKIVSDDFKVKGIFPFRQGLLKLYFVGNSTLYYFHPSYPDPYDDQHKNVAKAQSQKIGTEANILINAILDSGTGINLYYQLYKYTGKLTCVTMDNERNVFLGSGKKIEEAILTPDRLQQ